MWLHIQFVLTQLIRQGLSFPSILGCMFGPCSSVQLCKRILLTHLRVCIALEGHASIAAGQAILLGVLWAELHFRSLGRPVARCSVLASKRLILQMMAPVKSGPHTHINTLRVQAVWVGWTWTDTAWPRTVLNKLAVRLTASGHLTCQRWLDAIKQLSGQSLRAPV